MRDPERIQKFCNRLAAAWRTHPDLRFGQLIWNVWAGVDHDPFYIEDGEMIKLIEDHLYEVMK